MKWNNLTFCPLSSSGAWSGFSCNHYGSFSEYMRMDFGPLRITALLVVPTTSDQLVTVHQASHVYSLLLNTFCSPRCRALTMASRTTQNFCTAPVELLIQATWQSHPIINRSLARSPSTAGLVRCAHLQAFQEWSEGRQGWLHCLVLFLAVKQSQKFFLDNIIWFLKKKMTIQNPLGKFWHCALQHLIYEKYTDWERVMD